MKLFILWIGHNYWPAIILHKDGDTGESAYCEAAHQIHHVMKIQTSETTKPSHFCEGFVLYGAGTRSRTRDLLITSQLLYQLSYTGVLGRRL